MPIKVQSNLPAIKVLESENIFVMPNEVALRQDIRPLKILILKLMPTKIETETETNPTAGCELPESSFKVSFNSGQRQPC